MHEMMMIVRRSAEFQYWLQDHLLVESRAVRRYRGMLLQASFVAYLLFLVSFWMRGTAAIQIA